MNLIKKERESVYTVRLTETEIKMIIKGLIKLDEEHDEQRIRHELLNQLDDSLYLAEDIQEINDVRL